MLNKTSLEEYVTTQSFYSRRELLALLRLNKVKVNENVVTDLKYPITASEDSVKVDGVYIEYNYNYLYFKFYKPKGILSTMKDPDNRECIGDYIEQLKKPVTPVGRLDRQSSGLMILTNDGSFSNLLMHPSHKGEKEYYVQLDKKIEKKDFLRLEKGLILEDGPIVFSKASMLKSNKELRVSITEGRNRIIRRSFDHLGYKVKTLKREAVGCISLSGLNSGDIKSISKKEMQELRASCKDI